MARDFTKNTSNYLSLGNNQLSLLLDGLSAFSFHAWLYPESATTGAGDNSLLMARIADDETGFNPVLRYDGTNYNLRVRVRALSGDALQTRTGTRNSLTLNAWHPAGCVVDLPNDTIALYTHGAADNSGAASFLGAVYVNGSPSGPADTVGGSIDGPSTTAEQLDGRLAELALWDSNIGAAGFAQLALGFSPLLVRPRSLIFYLPLLGRGGAAGPESDLMQGIAGAITGSIGILDHPSILRPRRQSPASRPRMTPSGWHRHGVGGFALPVLSPGLLS